MSKIKRLYDAISTDEVVDSYLSAAQKIAEDRGSMAALEESTYAFCRVIGEILATEENKEPDSVLLAVLDNEELSSEEDQISFYREQISKKIKGGIEHLVLGLLPLHETRADLRRRKATLRELQLLVPREVIQTLLPYLSDEAKERIQERIVGIRKKIYLLRLPGAVLTVHDNLLDDQPLFILSNNAANPQDRVEPEEIPSSILEREAIVPHETTLLLPRHKVITAISETGMFIQNPSVSPQGETQSLSDSLATLAPYIQDRDREIVKKHALSHKRPDRRNLIDDICEAAIERVASEFCVNLPGHYASYDDFIADPKGVEVLRTKSNIFEVLRMMRATRKEIQDGITSAISLSGLLTNESVSFRDQVAESVLEPEQKAA